jgi:hypothetical protein
MDNPAKLLFMNNGDIMLILTLNNETITKKVGLGS